MARQHCLLHVFKLLAVLPVVIGCIIRSIDSFLFDRDILDPVWDMFGTIYGPIEVLGLVVGLSL